jgi:hypothetical protein
MSRLYPRHRVPTTSDQRTTTAMNHNTPTTRTPSRVAGVLTVLLATLAALAFNAGSATAAPAFGISLANDANDTQLLTVRATGGQFKLKYGDGGPGQAITADLAHDATTTQVQDALNALTNVSNAGGTVTVLNGELNTVTDARGYEIRFDGGNFIGTDVPALTALQGTTPLAGPHPDRLNVAPVLDAGIRRGDRRVNYEIRVRNSASPNPAVGGTLTCAPGGWFNSPTFTYQWERDGVSLGSANGAQTASYTVQPSDAGHVVQCGVLGTNVTGAVWSISDPTVIAPAPGVQPPAWPEVIEARPAVSGTGTNPRTCTIPDVWTGNPSFAFQWLRDGVPIPGATSSGYTPSAEDASKSLQCRVVGTNAGGSTAAAARFPSRVPPDLGPPPPPNNNNTGGRVSITSSDTTSGPVTVEVEMPAGLGSEVLAFSSGSDPFIPIDSGWSCMVQPAAGVVPAKGVCTRAQSLAAGSEYPPIGVGVGLGADAPDDSAVKVTVSGGGGPAVSVSDEFTFQPAVGFELVDGSLFTDVFDEAGGQYTVAGRHPHAASAYVSFSRKRWHTGPPTPAFPYQQDFSSRATPVEPIKTLATDTPPGFVGNPLAPTVTCDDPQGLIATPPTCPPESVVGAAYLGARGLGSHNFYGYANFAVAAITPERGEPAQFAFGVPQTKGIYVLNARLRPEDGYAVSIDSAPITTATPLLSLGATLCSYGATVENSGTHIQYKGCKSKGDPGAFEVPLFTNPTACSAEPLVTSMTASSWEHPDVFSTISVEEPAVTDCDQVPFTPTTTTALSSQAPGSASGFDTSIDVPADGLLDPDGVSQSHLKKTVVELPEGVSVNPSAATGLKGCSDAQLGLGTDAEPSCPDGSKLGTVEVTTPVLEETLTGVMVLRTPKSTDPMSGEMLRMALIVRNDERGILVKLPGSATADPQTGRLVATFDDNPQLPFDHLEVELRGGSRGVLAMPQTCGDKDTRVELTPWSGNEPATDTDTTSVQGDCSFGFAPKLQAGMSDSKARGSGEFSFKFSRGEGEQWIDGLTATLPQGLLASVKDVPLCGSADAEAGSCPAGSRVGTVDATAGAGDPFVLEDKGDVYLTVGYKGCAYGLAVKVPVVAGPFDGSSPETDLGDIIVRQSVCVDPTDAHVTATSDRFPTIWHGIPLRVRSVTVKIDRPGFMLNPSDCQARTVGALLRSPQDSTADLSTPFAASGCGDLSYKPRIALEAVGRRQVTTGTHPRLKAVVRQNGISEAGIEKAVVRLPKSLALDPNNAQALCEYADGTKPDLENHCPKGSIVGRARAKTPLLKNDLVGDVYFVKNVRRDPTTGNTIRTLPMIIVALRGEIAVNLKGESSTTNAGRLVNTFANVPDAPISQFNLNIKGGRNGILAVTRTRRSKINLCASRQIAEADTDGQNSRRHDFDIRMKTPCGKQQVKRAKRAAKKAALRARNARS